VDTASLNRCLSTGTVPELSNPRSSQHFTKSAFFIDERPGIGAAAAALVIVKVVLFVFFCFFFPTGYAAVVVALLGNRNAFRAFLVVVELHALFEEA
jgi:hypothetical protein